MEIQSFYCSVCAEKTIYDAIKPRFCSGCGQPFAVFANKPKNSVAAVAREVEAEEEEDNEEPKLTIKPASYYRNRVKGAQVEAEVEDDDDGETEGGDDDEDNDYQGGDPDLRASIVGQPNLLDNLTRNLKSNKGVKFSDIIKVTPEPQFNEPSKSAKPKTAKASSPKATGAKRGRPSKKT